MKDGKPYHRLLQMGMITFISVIIIIALAYFVLKRWEQELVQHRKAICVEKAARISGLVDEDKDIQSIITLLLQGDTINLASSRMAEEMLTEIVKKQVNDTEGLEGGFYISGLNDFIGYAYPTSESPIPAYGPPPRSYNIIKEQALASMESSDALVDMHAFDPAIFPLATHPLLINGQVAGAVWVRIHIERDLPLARLRKVLYIVTMIFGVGFMVMALFTLFLRNGIRSIQQELVGTRTDPGYRLKLRGGVFGFIPRWINEMLDLIEIEYKKRLELEKQLHHKEKLASLGKMIAGVAHEVRTPLSVIKTRVQIWENAVKQNKGKDMDLDSEAIGMVINEVDRVSDLMKRLVVFSRPIYDHLSPTSVDAILEEVLSMMDIEKSGENIRVVRKLQADSYLVNSDRNSLKQVFINILTNAKESLDDAGEITAETGFNPEKGSVTVKITDNGSGIDDDILENIFDPFYTTKATGTGLGLAISREIIISHGGEISFRHNEPRGTICFITLPMYKETT